MCLQLVNNAGAPIHLYWKNVFERPSSLVKQTTKPLRNSTDTTINSYDGHVFVVKFFNKSRNDSVEFAKLEEDETTTITYDEIDGLKVTQVTKFDVLAQEIEEAMNNCKNMNGDIDTTCVAKLALNKQIQLEKRHSEMTKYRNKISSRLRNYTCADPNMKTSKPFRSRTLSVNGKEYRLDDLFENEYSKIYVVEDLATDEECDIIMQGGKSKLTRATVAAEDGTSVISNHRRANQGIYKLNGNNDPLK